MKILILAFVLFIIIIIKNCSVALRTSDLCSTMFECNKNYSFKCKNKYCAKNNNSCIDFKKFLTQTNIKLAYLKSIKYKKKSILGYIKPCKHKIKLSNLCSRNSLCFKRKTNHLFVTKLVQIDSDHCNCSNQYPVKCNDHNYCGKDKTVCNSLKINDYIKKCGINKISIIILF